MNINAYLPLIVSIAYLPLLVATISARPLRRHHNLFLIFLIASLIWSLVDYFLLSGFLPQYRLSLFKLMLVICIITLVQFHTFISSFFPAGRSRWLALAYGFLALDVILVLLGIFPQHLAVTDQSMTVSYGYSIVLVVAPLLVLFFRNIYVLLPNLKNQENTTIFNQSSSLLLSLGIIGVFAFLSLLPFDKILPVNHLANIFSAIMLSYTVITREPIDIRLFIRQSLIWVCVGLFGIVCFWALLIGLGLAFEDNLNLQIMLTASVAGLIIVFLFYKLQNIFFRVFGMIFQGEKYFYRQKLFEFANQIHTVFSLKNQGGELLTLVIRSVGCRKAGLLFLDTLSDDFEVQLVEPVENANPLMGLRLKRENPVVEYLKRERKPLTYNRLSVLPEFRSLWQQEREIIESNEIELFMPLISREKLIGILILDKKQSGRYRVEDFAVLENVASRVAVSMEKEYLLEKLSEQEEVLSIINRSSAIITSSLDIQRIYDNFITELKRIVDIDWGAIAVVEKAEIYFMALSSEVGSPWKVGERLPLKGSASEWVVSHRAAIVEHDLSSESKFVTGKYFLQHNLHSVVYQPLIIANEVIGALILASQKKHVYSTRHLKLLEQLVAQIAMPIENARVYAKTEHMARVDELTGLLNRRSLNGILSSEIGRHSRYGGVFSFLLADLDSLKTINDNYGHLAGDEILRKTGNVIKRTIREADQAFRYGGDEFAILLPQTSADSALIVAERVREQVTSGVKYGAAETTISLGVASWPEDAINPKELIAAADASLYEAKHRGGNQSYASANHGVTLKLLVDGELENEDGSLSAIFALASSVDSRDRPADHSKKVRDFAVILAQKLGLSRAEVNHIATCALLHDVGKICINEGILNKKSLISAEEKEEVKTHSRVGAAIVSHSQQLAPCAIPILHLHEDYNGEGYPDHLKGEQIPLESRILALADAFAGLTSEGSSLPAFTYEEACAELYKEAGVKFDPKLIDVFAEALQISVFSGTKPT